MGGSVSRFEEMRCVVLASGSPRRRELLGQLIDSFEIIVSGVPEPVLAGLTPEANLLENARTKAAAVVPLAGGCVVLAADTDVILDGEILGKPADSEGAIAMLRRLRAREHAVLTALVVIDAVTKCRWERVVRSEVCIHPLTDTEIERYVATGEPLDKAGGYAIQGEAASMVASVEGCYTNVVGLPLCVTKEVLSQAGVAIRDDVRCEDPSGRSCPNSSR